MDKELSKEKLNLMLTAVNNTLNNIKFLKESAAYVGLEGFYRYVQSVIRFVERQPLAMEIVNSKRSRFYDVKSALDSGLFFDKMLNTPDEDDEHVAFVFEFLKYLLSRTKRFEIAEKIYNYRDKEETHQEKIKDSSIRNFIGKVIYPFLGIIEMELLNMKMNIENQKLTGLIINIAGNVGDHALIGDFSFNEGDIQSYNQVDD